MRTQVGLGLALALLVGCGGTPAEAGPEAESGKTIPGDGTFTLAVGEWAELPGAGLAVRLIEVADDSRCPVDVTCVWAGDAVAVIEVTLGGVEHAFGLHLNPGAATGPDRVEVGGYRIVLEAVAPEARSEAAIPRADYRATFRVIQID